MEARVNGLIDPTVQMENLYELIPAFERKQADPVHSLWEHQCWRTDRLDPNDRKLIFVRGTKLSFDLWRRLRPASALAALMLDASRGFASDVAFGSYAPCPDDPEHKLLVSRNEDDDEKTRVRLDTRMLDQIASRHVIQFDDCLGDGNSWAHTQLRNRANGNFVIVTSLDMKLQYALCDHSFESWPLQRKQALWFFIASILMHELMHAIWICRHGDEYECEPWTDVDIRDNSRRELGPELGRAWELWFFGMTVDADQECNSESLEDQSGLGTVILGHNSVAEDELACLFDRSRWKQLEERVSLTLPIDPTWLRRMPSRRPWIPPFEILCQDSAKFLELVTDNLFGDILRDSNMT